MTAADRALAHFEKVFGPEFGHGKAFDLARLNAALEALGAPHAKLPPVIHVAGTNGKGSTIAFMRAIAEAAGLSVHAFTKPHLMRLNERFVVAGEPASDEALIAAADEVAAAAPELTQFEAQVAAAFLLFSKTQADLALIETGMGGRDDATNVIAYPILSVITPIALDHQDTLGDTLKSIAAHKAGIIKRFAPVVTVRQAPDAMAVIEAAAARADVALHRAGVEWDAYASKGRLVVSTETRTLDLPLPALVGPHQIDNAGLAVAALLASPIAIDESAFAQGIASARWPGRLQPLTRGALAERAIAASAELWVDGGHNPHAAAALIRALDERNAKRSAKTMFIVGMRARKDWRAFVETLAPRGGVIAVPLSEDGADPSSIAAAAGKLGAAADIGADLPDALARALKHGAQRIVICGSLMLAAEALRL